MNPLHWGNEVWGLIVGVGSIVGLREWAKHYAPLQRWLHWRNRR